MVLTGESQADRVCRLEVAPPRLAFGRADPYADHPRVPAVPGDELVVRSGAPALVLDHREAPPQE